VYNPYDPIIVQLCGSNILIPEWGEILIMCTILAIYGYLAWRIAKA